MSKTQPIKDETSLQLFRSYYLEVNPNPRNHALLITGLNTGLRISDILRLHWKDVYDFQRLCYCTHIYLCEAKTNKSNVVPINNAVLEAMEHYRLSILSCSENDYIFRSRKGENQPIGREQAFRIIKEVVTYYHLDQHISCHSLRKTFGYNAWKQGTLPALLMSIFNHSSYQITKRYLGIDQDEKDDVYFKIFL